MALALESGRVRNVGTAVTTLYTAPSTPGIQVTINEILLCNVSEPQQPINVTVEYFDGTNATRLCYLVPIPAGATLPFQTKTNLKAGHSIRVQSSLANSLDACASPAELT